MKKQYFPGIDVLKSFGLYLMICGHMTLLDNRFTTIIYSFHMPLFFIISGMLSRDDDLKTTFKKTSITILYPYLFVNLILLVFTLLLNIYYGTLSISFIRTYVIPIIIGLGYECDGYSPVCTTMWFFYVLFFCKLISSLIPNSESKKIVLTLLILFVLYFFKMQRINTLFPVDSLFMAFPFYTFGSIIKKFIYVSTIKHIIILCLFLPIIYTSILWNGRIDIDTFQLGNSILLSYVNASYISVLLILISTRIKKQSFLTRISHHISSGASLVVGFNIWGIIVIKKIIYLFFPNLEWNNFYGFLLGIVLLLFLYPFILFCEHRIPIILGNRK